MKALVTGATGFVGSHLVETLLKKDFSVICLVRQTSNTQWLDDTRVSLLYGDCEDANSIFPALKGCDVVFHCAGLTKGKTERDFFSVNASGTENVIHAILRKNPEIKRFVYVSSLAAVGPSKNGNPIDETAPPSPVSWYGKSKLKGEEIVNKVREKIPITIVRPPAVFGPRDKDMYLLFKSVRKGFFPFFGNGRYSLIYVEDLAEAMVTAAENLNTVGKTYFVSDREIHTTEQIAALIGKSVGKDYIRLRLPRKILPVVGKIGEKMQKSGIINIDKIKEIQYLHWICNPQRFMDDTGFVNGVGVEKGVKWTADWYKIHRWI